MDPQKHSDNNSDCKSSEPGQDLKIKETLCVFTNSKSSLFLTKDIHQSTSLINMLKEK